jgi:ubiquinone/menaquinone biosynthesis C-methylase UbiE
MATKLAEAKKTDEEMKRRTILEKYISDSITWGAHAEMDEKGKVSVTRAVVSIVPILKENGVKKIIELGCGNGRDAIFLAKQGFDVTALESSPQALKIVEDKIREERIENVHPLLAHAAKIPVKDGAFDAALDLALLGGWGVDIDNSLLGSEIERILKPGGILLFAGWFSKTEVKENLFKNFSFFPPDKERLVDEYGWSAVLLLRKNE